MTHLNSVAFVPLLLLVLIPSVISATNRSFTVNHERGCFWKDDKECFQYISGSIHYPRIPHSYWEDRLLKVRAAGLNAITMYIFWNVHEPTKGEFNFEGDVDVVKFIQTADKLGLYVVLRPGPFNDAEIDMGGMPWWLLKDNPHMLLRTSDPTYLAALKQWYDELLPKLVPSLYVNGGNILSVQVENEYGSYYACDRNYTAWLRDLIKYHLGNEVLLFTTDGNNVGYLKCGTIQGVYPTVDFGVQANIQAVNNSFIAQMQYAKKGPKVNSEYYPGWFDQWGDKAHHQVSLNDTLRTMRDILSFNASMNVYMFEGGTNFGYLAGAEGSPTAYKSITTSYDYDAPLSEAGDPTPKFHAIRALIEDYTGKPVPYPVPPATRKVAYGAFKLKRIGSIIDELETVSPGWSRSKYPQSAEALGHGYGFILYVTKLNASGSTLTIQHPNDRAIILRNGVDHLGTLQRPTNTTVNAKLNAGDVLHILVENQGRICFGSWFNDSKGIVGNVTLDRNILTDWIMYPIVLERLFSRDSSRSVKSSPMYRRKRDSQMTSFDNFWPFGKPARSHNAATFLPSIYSGSVNTSDLADTYFDPSGWQKGQLLINGFNLGRYWPSAGPQQTLFVPKPFLKGGMSQVMMFEIGGAPTNCEDETKTNCFANFVDKPQLNPA